MIETAYKENVETRWPRARVWWMVLTIVWVGGLSGCAQVKPQADFARTRQLIGDRTGVEAVYDPDADALSAAEIEEALETGTSAMTQEEFGEEWHVRLPNGEEILLTTPFSRLAFAEESRS